MRSSPAPTIPGCCFDPPQLLELKKNIAEHGVLVPITVYQPKGQAKFSILDGERRTGASSILQTKNTSVKTESP
jgi:ParB-like chromosome segregation protein Spo0J